MEKSVHTTLLKLELMENVKMDGHFQLETEKDTYSMVHTFLINLVRKFILFRSKLTGADIPRTKAVDTVSGRVNVAVKCHFAYESFDKSEDRG